MRVQFTHVLWDGQPHKHGKHLICYKILYMRKTDKCIHTINLCQYNCLLNFIRPLTLLQMHQTWGVGGHLGRNLFQCISVNLLKGTQSTSILLHFNDCKNVEVAVFSFHMNIFFWLIYHVLLEDTVLWIFF